MKIRFLFIAPICALAAVLALQAQSTSTPTEPPKQSEAAKGADAAKHKEEHTELEEHMEKINGAWRKLNRKAPGAAAAPIADASKNEAHLKQLAIVREHMIAAAKLEPKLAADKPAADRPKFIAEYQERMKKEIETLDRIIAAVKAGNNEEAAKLAGVMNDAQKDAHKKFKKDTKKKS
jgi:soluble cytochrome b562